MQREVIRPENTPENPILSPAIKYGNLVFTAGMVGRDPKTGQLVSEDIREQSRQTLENIKTALEAAGTSMDLVLKATCFVADIDDRPAFNEVYQEFFTSSPPARTCVQAGRLGKGILIEVEVVAGIPS